MMCRWNNGTSCGNRNNGRCGCGCGCGCGCNRDRDWDWDWSWASDRRTRQAFREGFRLGYQEGFQDGLLRRSCRSCSDSIGILEAADAAVLTEGTGCRSCSGGC